MSVWSLYDLQFPRYKLTLIESAPLPFNENETKWSDFLSPAGRGLEEFLFQISDFFVNSEGR